jgi:hypothetical protein
MEKGIIEIGHCEDLSIGNPVIVLNQVALIAGVTEESIILDRPIIGIKGNVVPKNICKQKFFVTSNSKSLIIN